MTTTGTRRSPLAMTALLLLHQQPLHPYGLRQLILQWNKDRVVNVTQRNAIYQVVDRLERAGLITVKETARRERRPERTVYEVTDEGRKIAEQWLLEMMTTPATEYPEFPAALSFLDTLGPEASMRAFEQRAAALQDKITTFDEEIAAALAAIPGQVDRIYLVENEYIRTMLVAELGWVNEMVEDIRQGRMSSGWPKQ